jgi:hypothetical protein
LHRVFGWSVDHFRICNMNALGAAFASEGVRARLARELSHGYERLG